MRSRRAHQEHDEAVARRLSQLSAELALSRDDTGMSADRGEWWEGHTRVSASRRSAGAPMPAPVPRQVPSPSPSPSPNPSHNPSHGFGPTTDQPPPRVPMPGRHAARRRRQIVTEAVPATLRGRIELGSGQVAVVALLIALGLGATTWWVVRGDAQLRPQMTPPAAPLLATSGGELVALPPTATTPPLSTVSAGTVTVDVTGKVRRPGIAVLDAGARVVDAVKAAGGARAGVDLSTLNLARVLMDGEQVVVGHVPGAVAIGPVLPAPGGGPVPGALVNLNLAGQAELESLPEVGPVTAMAILTWRDEHGSFTDVSELLEVDGIGDATLAQLTPYVTL